MLWAMPGLRSGGLLGKKFGRGVRAAAAVGALQARGDQLAPLPGAAPLGSPQRLGSDVTCRAVVCREMDFRKCLIAFPCKMK